MYVVAQRTVMELPHVHWDIHTVVFESWMWGSTSVCEHNPTNSDNMSVQRTLYIVLEAVTEVVGVHVCTCWPVKVRLDGRWTLQEPRRKKATHKHTQTWVPPFNTSSWSSQRHTGPAEGPGQRETKGASCSRLSHPTVFCSTMEAPTARRLVLVAVLVLASVERSGQSHPVNVNLCLSVGVKRWRGGEPPLQVSGRDQSVEKKTGY